MPIPVVCSACSRSYQVREEFANRTIQCKSCGEPMTVPASPADDREEPSGRTGATRSEPADDWAQAFGGASGGSRKGGPRKASSAGRAGRSSRSRDDLDDDEGEFTRGEKKVRSLRGKSGTSPLVWVLVGLSVLATFFALGLGVWFGMQRRTQTAPAPGPGGFPGNNPVPGQLPIPPGPAPINPGPIGPNLKADPRQPGGFPTAPNPPGR